MKILDIDHNTVHVEVFILQVGETFPGFGGSKQGLVVRKTPSLIVRNNVKESGEVRDAEYDINDTMIWGKIRTAIEVECLQNGHL